MSCRVNFDEYDNIPGFVKMRSPDWSEFECDDVNELSRRATLFPSGLLHENKCFVKISVQIGKILSLVLNLRDITALLSQN